VSPARAAARALLPFLLHALSRETDAALGLFLRAGIAASAPLGHVLALVGRDGLALRAAAWLAAGAVLWLLLAAARRLRSGEAMGEALRRESHGFWPLLLRPALTLAALAAVALAPAFPYAFTLPVALTQDLGVAQDALALAAFVALRAPRASSLATLPVPTPASLAFLAFLAYGLLTPEWAWRWQGHPGNEPKTLRMAVAIGHDLTLDVEGVSAPMEQLAPRPLLPAAHDAAVAVARESWHMLGAVVRGEAGADAITATRLARQTVAGKNGGVFHVLAPGASMLLAPALRLDRALNRARGTPGRLAVSVLAWNALAALLVGALAALLRDATGRPGLSAALAAGFALLPPYLFYAWQLYPEMLGALALALLFRELAFGRLCGQARLLAIGVGLAVLPWLHQKFLPVWAVLAVLFVATAVNRLVTLRGLLALALPQAVSGLLFLVYNFAITGSARPDALFLAWGPGGVTTARVGDGLLGLALDARYGLLPYVPLYLLAAGGVLLDGPAARRLRLLLLPAAVYYGTVAAADNWSGAVCNLGRYVMPVTPLAAAFAALALARVGGTRPLAEAPRVLVAGSARAVAAVALALAAWSGLLALELYRDPHAANDAARLLAASALADGNDYVPNLFFRSTLYRSPGTDARVLAWLGLAGLLGLWLGRSARRGERKPHAPGGSGGGRVARAVAGLVLAVLSAALVLERWPRTRAAPAFHDALGLGPGRAVFVRHGGDVREDYAACGAGHVALLVRGVEPLTSLTVVAEGPGVLRRPGQPDVLIPPSGTRFELSLAPMRALTSRDGARATLQQGLLTVDTPETVYLRFPGAR
jgi:hypothetical protein